MRIWVVVFVAFVLPAHPATAQAAPMRDALLDRLVGEWVLAGTIAGNSTTHDVSADWVLGHQYVRTYEVSRERDRTGAAIYEALVLVSRDPDTGRYGCLWIDNTGGGKLLPEAIGYGVASGDSIPFLFHDPSGGAFHTTFVYDAGTDRWEWHMDGEQNGTLQPFARVTLTRK